MNREQRDPNVIEFVAPEGGVVAGKMYAVGSGLVVVAMGGVEDIAEGDSASGILHIHAPLDAATGETWERGDDLFYEPTESVLTKTNTGALSRVAKATEDKGTDDATGWALFDGTNAGVANQGDITGVTAGTGLTGGGTTGTVTVALSAGSIASLGLADSSVQPGAVLTDGTLPVANADGELVDSALTDTAATTLTDGSNADALHTHAAESISYTHEEIEATDVAGALDEVIDEVERLDDVTVVIALGAATGSSAADPDMIGAEVMAIVPVSGNDAIVSGHSVGVDGAITITTATNETAEATFSVKVKKALPA